MHLYLGIDVGSISANFALIDSNRKVLDTFYARTFGEPSKIVHDIVQNYYYSYKETLKGLTFTGTGGKSFKDFFGNEYINEIIAHVLAVDYSKLDVCTIIEIGGQDSKLIFTKKNNEHLKLENFSMNTVCAAGTGSFLDQQAFRLNIPIEQFGEYALKSKKPARIAGRCSVFAKSDMIHLQQESTPLEDIIYGLCYALARNYIATLSRGQTFKKPIIFQGGVAANEGMVRAFESLLGLSQGELIIPHYYDCMGAIGAALTAVNERVSTNIKEFLTKLEYLEPSATPTKLGVLKSFCLGAIKTEPSLFTPPFYLGIDIGSVSVNLAIIDSENRLVAKKYSRVEGNPIQAVRSALHEIQKDLKENIKIKSVGITGSGRYLIGNYTGADVCKDEITAQAKGIIAINPKVDTIFEIGGQDSKYIRIQNGVITEFEMNKACAAGTGSFLDEQASRLGINIEKFGDLAISASNPVALGERCTVFMESDLIHYQQIGVAKENLIAGLSYSIAYNYLNKVVAPHKIGDYISFQGGVAFNKGVIAAFEQILGKSIFIPEHHEIMGAFGIALITKESNIIKTRFKGFNFNENYKLQTFGCTCCPNNCEIKQLVVNEEKTYYGSRCGKYDITTNSFKDSSNSYNKDSLFKQYNEILTSYAKMSDFQPKVGFPFCLGLYETLPFWSSFFRNLGFNLEISNPNKAIIDKGLKVCSADLCYPVKILHANILDLLDKHVDFIFLPYVISQSSLEDKYMCPYIQTAPDIIKATMRNLLHINLFTPTIDLSQEKLVIKELEKLVKLLQRSKSQIRIAYYEAKEAYSRFQNYIQQIAQIVLKDKEEVIILIGRAYNIFDSRINLGIPEILEKFFNKVIPITFFPNFSIDNNFYTSEMYWSYGQKILDIANYIKDIPNIHPVYLTNFGCGQDSMLVQVFQKILGDKPYLLLEIDEHSSSTGLITRCEAFANTLKTVRI
jgi:predicted CoA-substrate-specific enzyme activase